MIASWQESYDKPRQWVKKQRQHFTDKGLYSQDYGVSSSHIWLLELDHKGRIPKNWCFWTVVLEKTLEGPLDSKEIKPVHPKGNQPWILIRRTNDEAEAPIFWSHDANSQLIGKDHDSGKGWQQEKAARGWDGYTASLKQWSWTWANCRR